MHLIVWSPDHERTFCGFGWWVPRKGAPAVLGAGWARRGDELVFHAAVSVAGGGEVPRVRFEGVNVCRRMAPPSCQSFPSPAPLARHRSSG